MVDGKLRFAEGCPLREDEAGTVSRRGAIARLAQLCLAGIGLALLDACPGGSDFRKAKLQGAQPLPPRPATDGQSATPPADAPGELTIELAALKDGVPVEMQYQGRTLYFLRTIQAGGEWIGVLDRVCPHAGCIVEYQEASRSFVCPCHKSAFALDGSVTRGPADRGLLRLTARTRGTQAVVDMSGQG